MILKLLNNITTQENTRHRQIYDSCWLKMNKEEALPTPPPTPPPPSSKCGYSIEWKYGEKARDDRVEIDKNENKKRMILKRWTTFRCFHFPSGAIVTGFRGRRDYKDGKCQGIMCCRWSPEKRIFMPFIFTISNGYNDTFSERDFETIEIVDECEFTFYNAHAIKNIKKELK